MTRIALLATLVLAACGKHEPPLQKHFNEYFTRFADALDAAHGDCDKLAAGIEPLVPLAKQIAAECKQDRAAAEQMKPLPDDVYSRFDRASGFLERCEETSSRAHRALEANFNALIPLDDVIKALFK